MIDKKMTILDLVDKYPQTEDIIREYDERVGACILCKCLFDSIEEIENTYNVNLQDMFERLKTVI